MTDLEKELLERVISLTVQLNEEKAVREHNDFVYTDFQEVIARLREELKVSQAQGKELCKIVDGLKKKNRLLECKVNVSEMYKCRCF